MVRWEEGESGGRLNLADEHGDPELGGELLRIRSDGVAVHGCLRGKASAAEQLRPARSTLHIAPVHNKRKLDREQFLWRVRG